MELWSPAHIRSLLPSIGVMLILCVLLRLWLGKKPLRVRMIPIQVIAVLLILLEIGKQDQGLRPLPYSPAFLLPVPVLHPPHGLLSGQA